MPSNLARRVVADLQQFGEVRRGSIGYVEIAPLTTQLASELGAPDTRGVLVTRMRRDSSAYDAGLRPGDVVVTFNGTPVTDGGQLSRLIQDSRIGSTASVRRPPRRPPHRDPDPHRTHDELSGGLRTTGSGLRAAISEAGSHRKSPKPEAVARSP